MNRLLGLRCMPALHQMASGLLGAQPAQAANILGGIRWAMLHCCTHDTACNTCQHQGGIAHSANLGSRRLGSPVHLAGLCGTPSSLGTLPLASVRSLAGAQCSLVLQLALGMCQPNLWCPSQWPVHSHPLRCFAACCCVQMMMVYDSSGAGQSAHTA